MTQRDPRPRPTRSEILSHVWEIYEAGGLLTSCAWCERILVDGAWVAGGRAALAHVDEPMMLSHSICPGCAGRTGW